MISVQEHDFSIKDEHEALLIHGSSGAVVFFIGHVRKFSDDKKTEFLLQHYPGMTEKALRNIEKEAKKRWRLTETRIIHRVGKLEIGEQIVFVGASSAHRSDAFQASEYMIDILKTEAPFWKKEGSLWVQAKDSDNAAADKWTLSND